jgi:hypothetical protein
MPELCQVVGAILRDVSQARFMSDLYSRQISFSYENDSLLRRFPVPRAEIEEVEFNLPFVVTGVRVDEKRHQSRNAAVGRIFDDYSLRIVRAGLKPVQDAFETATKGLPADPKNPTEDEKQKKAVADRFQGRILSDDYRSNLHGRLLRFLNEETSTLITKDGFDTALLIDAVKKLIDGVRSEPEVAAFQAQFPVLNDAFDKAALAVKDPLAEMGKAVNDAMQKYPDYMVDVELGPDVLKNNPTAASYIKVKAVVKNYHWSKVDVDSKDMRNLRTLVPE